MCAFMSITEKVLGSSNTDERKILVDDVNQIRQVIQTGEKDLKTKNVSLLGNTITADNGANWIRRYGNTFQFYNGSSWQEPSTANLLTFTAGENIAARDVVYLKVSDGKIYKASTANSDWIGVATSAITSGASGTVYPNGSLVGGFSGLTSGTWYKVNASAGTIDASDLSITNTQYNVGVAVSATQLILIKNQLNGITNEVNNKNKILQIYTSTGLNLNLGSGGNTSANIESNDIYSNASYISIKLNGYLSIAGGGQNSFNKAATLYYKIEKKELGGDYSDALSNSVLSGISHANSNGDYAVIRNQKLISFEYIHALSAGEKTNGIKFKLTLNGVTETGNNIALAFTLNSVIISILT